jgi:hypothetical protein
MPGHQQRGSTSRPAIAGGGPGAIRNENGRQIAQRRGEAEYEFVFAQKLQERHLEPTGERRRRRVVQAARERIGRVIRLDQPERHMFVEGERAG